MLRGIDPINEKITGPQGPKTPIELFEGDGALEGAADAVLDNVDTGVFELPLRRGASARSIRALMKKHARVPMDFADACLVQLADDVGSGAILTLDSDFRVYRWRKTRRFELLLGV